MSAARVRRVPALSPPPRRAKTIEEQVPAPWHRPSGDDLFGIQAIADYLELPFLDVRTLLKLRRLPAEKVLIAHAARRTALVAHFLELERRFVDDRFAAPPPANTRPNGAIGLIKSASAIAAQIGCVRETLEGWRRAHGLPVFRVGKHWMARRASLDLWRAHVAMETPSERRRVSLLEKRTAAAPAGAIVGGAAIAAALGIPEAATRKAISRGAIPAFRVGKGWAADPAALAAVKANMDRRAQDGDRH